MSIFKKDNKKELWQWGLLSGLAEAVYIALIASLFMGLNHLAPMRAGFIWPILFFLTLFVFSAVVSGLLVLGRPIFLALHQKYKEALLTLAISLGVLLLMLIVIILLAAL